MDIKIKNGSNKTFRESTNSFSEFDADAKQDAGLTA